MTKDDKHTSWANRLAPHRRKLYYSFTLAIHCVAEVIRFNQGEPCREQSTAGQAAYAGQESGLSDGRLSESGA